MDFTNSLLESIRQEGFPLAGLVDIARALPMLQPHIDKYDQWLEAGYAGEMNYLVRGRDRRADPRLVFPEAKSVLSVAISYPRKPAGSIDLSQGPRYARYLQGADYHDTIPKKLEAALSRVKTQFPKLEYKICVDTSAVLERSWAALAGLGWIGKNTLLIHPKLGSYLFLGAVLLNQETGREPAPIQDLCGHCQRCLEACPTRAFTEPHTLNSNRCISYWTLEKRGELNLSPEDRRAMGTWIAGCDICQEACPFNLKPSRETDPEITPESDATRVVTWEALQAETEEEYKKRIAGSALNRVKPAQFKRNLEINIRNRIS